MRLPDEVLKCVAFLGRKEMDPKTGLISVVYGGTGFFVGIRSDIPGADIVFLVTAAHVAKRVEDGEFCIRCNDKNGKAKEYWLDAGLDVHWWTHPEDPTVDVAVLPWSPPPEEIDFRYVPENMFLPRETMLAKGIGIGDEVYVVGLFRLVTGKDSNQVVTRMGSLSMVSTERIPSANWHAAGIEGFLVELRSIGGLSGSPVFIQRSIEVQPTEDTGRKPLAAGAVFWLGLMHGHWDVQESQVDGLASDAWGKGHGHVNTGMAIVVPYDKIMEVIKQEELRYWAEAAMQEFRTHNQQILQGGSPAGTAVTEGHERLATYGLTSVASRIVSPSSGTVTPVFDFLKERRS
ncbi:hypothetical protein [Bradyrhizobium sp. DOA9]|uniref:hypothetical protein n=1 Tax=Bradyrhizobium sp. DOA9 TaxID=1126627 RepID=UPI0012603C7F|nr:hypothetical protein [Bradyrhizobium sp. DOA9]